MRSTIRKSGIIAALLLVAGCARARPPAPQAAPVAAVRRLAIDPSARVYYNDGSGLKDSVRLAIRDSKGWTDLWRQINSGESSPPALPQVDFTQEMLLVAGAGRMSPGDQIKIDSIADVNSTLSVIVRIRVECRRFSGSSFPLEIVRITRTTSRVVFEERREKPGCGGP